MFQDLKPYPEYVEAKEPWLGSIPASWETRRFRYLLSETDARSTTGEEQLLRVSQYTGVTERRGNGGAPDTRAASLVGYKLVEANQLAVNIMLAWNGSLGVSRFRGIVSPAYCVYAVGPDLDPWYLHHLLRSPVYKDRIRVESRGIVESRLRLYTDDLNRLLGLVPPIDEQRAIVKYLAHAHQRINEAIATKRKLVAAARESKRAITQNYVRTGLDTGVSFRESGIPWVGAVPTHWEIRRIANVFDNLDYRRIPLSTEVRGRMTERRFDYYGASGVIDQVEDYIFDEPTILIAEDGANLVLRNLPLAIKAEGKYWVNNHAHILRPRFGDIDYYVALLESIDYRPWISGAAQPKLTQDRLKSVSIAVPPVNEQAAIVRQIVRETSVLDQMIARTSDEIGLLNEFKTRLTADIVTGQLDVRSIAATLPPIESADVFAASADAVGAEEDEMADEADMEDE